MTAKNLGDILLERGIIDRDALERALHLQQRRLGEILIEEKLADPVAIASALKFQASSMPQRRLTRLSVEAKTLDDLLRRLEAIEDQVGGAAGGDRAFPAVVSLRQTVEMLLLEPVESLFQRARWVLAQAAGELGKKIDATFAGGGLVVDRSLVEDLADVVLHLVRNAADHGIEAPDERGAAGKTFEGRVEVQVAMSAGRLLLTVRDDGRGIDAAKVYAKAKAEGLVTAARESIPDAELFKVIFTPGFSTVDKVTALSGRGVGLDVVEATAIRLGGDVSIATTLGQGTAFVVSVPLRYARAAILPLRVGHQWVAVNAADVASISAPANSTDAASALPASTLFPGSPETLATSPGAVLVHCFGGARWLFDEAGSPEDVMVRETSSFAKGSLGVVGGARMRDGRSVILVDLDALTPATKRPPS